MPDARVVRLHGIQPSEAARDNAQSHMTNKAITVEVQQSGQKSRLFRLDKNEVSIGFSQHCHIALEPQVGDGSELLLLTHQSVPHTLRPLGKSEAFKLNGDPCSEEVEIKVGDVITTDSYRITIRTLPADSSITSSAMADGDGDATETGAASLEAATVPSNVTATKGQQSAQASKPKPGLSYLYLFFAPVQEYLMDDDVAEIMINGPKQIYIERKGR